MRSDTVVARQQHLGGLARVALAGLIWGSIPLILRSTDGAPVVKVFFRVAFAAAVIAVWLVASGRLGELRSLPREKWLQLIGQGLVLCLNWYLFLTAFEYTTVATAELLGYTGPVFVAILAPLVTREPFDRRIVAPLLLALLGIVVILAPHGLSVTSGRERLGASLAFASALTYATLLLRSKKILQGVSVSTLMIVEYTVSALALSPLVIAAYLRGDVPTTAGAYLSLATLGVVHTAIAGYLFFGGVRRVRTDHVAVMTYIEPVSAVLFAALLLSEPLTLTTVAGGAMVVLGGLLVTRIEALEPAPIETAGVEGDLDPE